MAVTPVCATESTQKGADRQHLAIGAPVGVMPPASDFVVVVDFN
jgi:hypothetical protein